MLDITPPNRIVIIRPCCIGDVVLATAAVQAVHRAYPEAHLTVAVGTWSQRAIAHHPAIDAWIDTGAAAMPVKSVRGFGRMVRDLRAGQFDWCISLVRSPLMSAAVGLSGIPLRAGIDSNGRGFGYNRRLPVHPAEARHEAAIYLDVVGLLGIDIDECYPQIPVSEAARLDVQQRLSERGSKGAYVVINPTGGNNPGMTMSSKRWPPQHFAAVADHLVQQYGLQVVLLGGPNDGLIIEAVQAHMANPAITFLGDLSFPQIGALAADSKLYLGNDTGLTHLAAASGAKTAMVLGPSDPKRYAPYAKDSLALWKPTAIPAGGVAANAAARWEWARNGITPDDAIPQLETFLQR